MSQQVTPEQAQAQILSEEFASQVVALTQRLASQRVHSMQLQQSLDAAMAELDALRSDGDSPSDPEDHPASR